MKYAFFLIAISAMLSSCIFTAPISVAFRSNASQQTASTDAKNDKASDNNSVNADKTLDTNAAVTTSTGTATTDK